MMTRNILEYFCYRNAKSRCCNRSNKGWKNYGGRGIEFRFNSFAEFFAELGPRPKGLTLDRKDNDGHYEPGNVRWATRKEQQNNRRLTVAIRRAYSRLGKRGDKSKGGRAASFRHPGLPSHYRWHVNRGVTSPSCKYCRGIV